MSKTLFLACPDCDLLLKREQNLQLGDKVHCPRCGCLLEKSSHNSIEKTFALAVSGLCLLFPANILPLIGIKMMSNSHDSTLWQGVMTLFSEGFWLVASLVFLTSILFPAINMVLAFFISAHLYFHRPHIALARYFRYWLALSEWAMLEVYLLGIIVASVKLESMAELKFDLGLLAFIALLLVNVLLSSQLNESLFWQRIAQLHDK